MTRPSDHNAAHPAEKTETVPENLKGNASANEKLHGASVVSHKEDAAIRNNYHNAGESYLSQMQTGFTDSARSNNQEKILLAQANPEKTERQLHETTVQDLKDEGVMLRRYQQEDHMYGTHKYADEMKYLQERQQGLHEGPLSKDAIAAIMYWKDHNYGKDEIGNWANRYSQSNLTDQQVQADLRQKMNDPKFPMTQADANAVLNAYRAEKNRH
jgi:hypothetical protein